MVSQNSCKKTSLKPIQVQTLPTPNLSMTVYPFFFKKKLIFFKSIIKKATLYYVFFTFSKTYTRKMEQTEVSNLSTLTPKTVLKKKEVSFEQLEEPTDVPSVTEIEEEKEKQTVSESVSPTLPVQTTTPRGPQTLVLYPGGEQAGIALACLLSYSRLVDSKALPDIRESNYTKSLKTVFEELKNSKDYTTCIVVCCRKFTSKFCYFYGKVFEHHFYNDQLCRVCTFKTIKC